MTSTKTADEMGIELADLRSRLTWGPVFNLTDLTDNEKQQALCQRAKQNGLELPEKVADYLIQHYPRDIFSLFERLRTLDKASLAMQRRLTIPLIKTVFSTN
jgi:DnaA family protein